MTYAEKLKDPRWQKKRLEILQRDGWGCRLCHREDKTLHVHHVEYIDGKEPWDYPGELLITLCEHCHEIYHLPFDILQDDGFIKIHDFFKILGTEIICRTYFEAIENHEGNWILYLRPETDLNNVYELITVLQHIQKLKGFIEHVDCNIVISKDGLSTDIFNEITPNKHFYYGKEIH